LLGRFGKVWQDESFDRALRHEESITDKLDYISEIRWRGTVHDPLDTAWTWRESRVKTEREETLKIRASTGPTSGAKDRGRPRSVGFIPVSRHSSIVQWVVNQSPPTGFSED